MRTPDVATVGLRAQRCRQIKVLVGGVDLTSYEGRDWLAEAEWGVNVDQAVSMASLKLWREEYWLSLAPFNAASKPNLPSGSYDPLLKLGALVVIYASEAITRAAADAVGTSTPWHEAWRGRVIEIDWAGNPMSLRCADMASEVADAWLQRERWYGRGHQCRGTLVWQASMPVALGELVMASDARAVSDIWECVQAGTTGTLEPTWRSIVWAPGKTVNEGDRLRRTTSAFWIVTSAGGTTGATEPDWDDPSPITDGSVEWTLVTGSAGPRTDGSAKWNYYPVGTSMWAPETVYAVGAYVASGRYFARPWAANTEYAPGDQILRSTPTVHRYVSENSVPFKTEASEPDWAGQAPNVGDLVLESPVAPYGEGAVWRRLPDDRSTDCGEDRFMCTVGGTSDAGLRSEPDWPDTEGASVDEGDGVRWTRIAITSDGLIPLEAVLAGMLADAEVDNGITAPDMVNAASPGYYLQPFPQAPMSCLEAMRRVAGQIGWDLRLVYVPTATDHATWGRWRLSLFEPDRSATTSLATFSPDDYQVVRRGVQKLSDVRNVAEGVYSDHSDMQPNGVDPTRKRVVREDAASIAKYGRRWIGLGAGTSNEVNTLAEMQALLDAVLSDLAEPTADVEVELPMRWWVELGDLYTLGADGRLFSEDQKLAVVGFKHQVRQGDARTALQLRGKPSAGVRRWLDRGAGPGKANPSVSVAGLAPSEDGITVSEEVFGGVVTFDPPPTLDKPGQGGGFSRAELHLSTTSGFTPSASTLKSVSTSTRFDVTGLVAGLTYYGRIVIVDARGNRSAPSPQFVLRPTGQFGCQLSTAADQAVETGDLVVFDTADLDPASMLDDDREGADAPMDGIYDVSASARLTGLDPAGDGAQLAIKVNGTIEYTGARTIVFGDGLVSARCLLELDEGDAVRVHLISDSSCSLESGATLTVSRTLIQP